MTSDLWDNWNCPPVSEGGADAIRCGLARGCKVEGDHDLGNFIPSAPPGRNSFKFNKLYIRHGISKKIFGHKYKISLQQTVNQLE